VGFTVKFPGSEYKCSIPLEITSDVPVVIIDTTKPLVGEPPRFENSNMDTNMLEFDEDPAGQ